MIKISACIFKPLKTLRGWIACMIACLLMSGCLKEEVDIAVPKPGPVQVQLHNFNTPLNGGALDGTAPDIYYFKQKEDGSFVFMLTSINYKGFETNWSKEYVIVHTDKNGIIQTTKVMKLPSKDGITGTFDYVWDTPPNRNDWFGFQISQYVKGTSYVADDKGFLYYQPDLNCLCQNLYFNLNPESGQVDYFSVGAETIHPNSFRTSDGGFISVGAAYSPDYSKYSESGLLQFKQPIKYWEASPSYSHVTDRNGDSYFIVMYNGLSFWGSPIEWFSENAATSFFTLKSLYIYNAFGRLMVDVEIRFGPGKTQKAHRFILAPGQIDYKFEYKDYVEVPFEVWDLTNNRQVMVSFTDQRGDGAFDLIHKKIDYVANNWWLDPALSNERIHITPEIPYSSNPDEKIKIAGTNSFQYVTTYNVLGYLTEGASWNPTALPPSSFSLKVGPRPAPQLIKVNANGSSVVMENYALGTVPMKNTFKTVPYNEGFAVLINVPSSTSEYQPTQLVILDAAFKQNDVISMTSTAADYGHQLEGSNDRVFYSRITTSPNSNGSKRSLLLSVVRDNMKIDRSLDDVLKVGDLENYRITPTRTGGVAIVAWVRPTDNTRDLIFVEFDENLKLIAGPNGK